MIKTKYLNICIRPPKVDSGKTMYFENPNPTGKLMQKEIKNANT